MFNSTSFLPIIHLMESNLKKTFFFSLTLAIALYAYANQRTVSIPVSPDGITLINGSPANVDYAVTCYSGTNSTNLGAMSLGARASTKIGIGGIPSVCNNGTNVQFADQFLNGMFSCGYTDWTTYQTVCPTGFHRCSSGEVAANYGTYTNFNGFLIESSDFSNVWYYRFNSTSAWNVATQSSSSYPLWSNGSAGECNKGDTNNAGLNVANCVSGSWGETPCCPNFIATTCDVTIQSTTPQTGYLQSPQFKSNAPF